MKAITISRFGAPEGLKMQERATPTPSQGEVLVTTEAIGVGGVDAAIRRGTLGNGFPLGMIPGGEVAGVITQIGDGVAAHWLGARVWAHTGTAGGYADYAVASVEDVTLLPDALTAAEAVAVGSAATVASFALRRASLTAGETLLVRGAAGSIGIAAVEHALQQDASKIAVTTSSESRGKRLVALGATDVLNRDGHDLSHTTGEYDVILDIVGGANVPAFIDMLAPNGRMILVGAVAGLPPATFGMRIMESFQRSRSVAAFSLASIPAAERSETRATLFNAVVNHQLTPVIHSTMPLADAAKAHAEMDAGTVFGRIVLTN